MVSLVCLPDDGSEAMLNGEIFVPVGIGNASVFSLVGDVKVDKITVLRRIRPKLEDTLAGKDIFPDGFEFITLPDGSPVSREKESCLPVLRCGGFIVLHALSDSNPKHVGEDAEEGGRI